MMIVQLVVFFLIIFPHAVCIAKPVISKDDLIPIGSFTLSNAGYPQGLALRRDGATIKLYTVSQSGELLEYEPPATYTNNAPFANAVNRVSYGNAFDGVDSTLTATEDNQIQGLWFDGQNNRLYFAKTVIYNTTTTASDTCVGYATIDTNARTSTGIGAYSVSPPSSQGGIGNRWAFSIAKIPDWFATAYTNGRTMALGFGGATSIISNGPASMGPGIIAIDPPDAIYDTDNQQITRGHTVLALHPYSTSLSIYKRAVKPTSLMTHIFRADGDYTGENNWFNLNDILYHGTWHDGNKHGVLIFATINSGTADTTISSETTPSASIFSVVDKGDIGTGTGDLIYVNGTLATVASVVGNTITLTSPLGFIPEVGQEVKAGIFYAGGVVTTRWHHALYIYNPDDLALVAQGSKNFDDVAPTTVELFEYPDISYPMSGTNQESRPGREVMGVTYDGVDKKIYVGVKRPSGTMSVHVYQINDSISGYLRLPPGQAKQTTGTGKFIQ